MIRPRRRWAVVLTALGLVVAGVLPRLLWGLYFPTRPISDFARFIEFALLFKDRIAPPSDYHWTYSNPGLPLLLSFVFRIVPGNPYAIARIATAVATGLLPLIPFFAWRRQRDGKTAALLLALWPGQVFFSNVVAQDNWVLLPSVALAALSIHVLRDPDGRAFPVAASLLFACGFMIRLDMAVALAPLAAVAGGVVRGSAIVWRRLITWSLFVGSCLLLLSVQRYAATGRFSFTTEHAGIALLGAFAPGAGIDYWKDPRPHVAAVAPDLLHDQQRYRREAFSLALDEALRRPGFHLARIGSSILGCLSLGEASLFYWSLTHGEVLPADRQAQGVAFANGTGRKILRGTLLIHGLFTAVVVTAIARRHAPVLLLALAIGLKITVHAALATQPRYFVPVTALELMAIAVGARWLRYKPILASLAAVITIGTLGYAVLPLQEWILAHERDRQLTYRFSLFDPSGTSRLDCTMAEGALLEIGAAGVTIAPLARDPNPGDRGRVVCELWPLRASALVIRLLDGYPAGGLPGRIEQQVVLDGREIYRHDIAAAPGSGWTDIRLGEIRPLQNRRLEVCVTAVRPDPGLAWGLAARTAFEIATYGPLRGRSE